MSLKKSGALLYLDQISNGTSQGEVGWFLFCDTPSVEGLKSNFIHAIGLWGENTNRIPLTVLTIVLQYASNCKVPEIDKTTTVHVVLELNFISATIKWL